MSKCNYVYQFSLEIHQKNISQKQPELRKSLLCYEGCVRYIFAIFDKLLLQVEKRVALKLRKVFFISLQELFSFLWYSTFRVLNFLKSSNA